MTTATWLLLTIGILGAFDIAWFHSYKARLVTRPECRREALLHVVRGGVYAAQFLCVPNLRLTGAWYLGWLVLFGVDVAVAFLDVREEPRSRAPQGGLSGGEYLMHVVLSVGVGALLHAVFSATWGDWRLPTQVLGSDVPGALRVAAGCMAVGCLGVSALEALVLIDSSSGPPAPLHVRVRLPATVEQVWNLTQDHRLHPRWDHRFSSIVMLHEDAHGPPTVPLGMPDPRIQTGTVMRYEKTVLGASIRGFGRYKLHRPMQQSTFEFWSEEPLSLIARGVGLWRYTALPEGGMEFATSYTYEVRWGALGRVVDRFVFRPLFQRYTEQSFTRLARRYFGVRRPRVLGRDGRKPRTFSPRVEAV
ncbi:SRPBCC family protein [Stigmatella sp. ncwal1]|uniref:SRPBCC family protein n=1 Tax=Stigmatella ashevillensis TaxID=2995309 RepID=A0ABT5DCL1_9BACT|nr:SRPBCC family protein [Stigmatella ashevillena]MDC0711417.1 SRPBCC family protein [Stigmatella ashevillena]